ncbi:Axial budding pattern protein 2 [Yarrowia sp. B02]|nr:Axial budding pattern protein 2 [Yarrowia sp. B02]
MLVKSLLLATAVVAAPSAGYPFNSQLPPVARWGQNYAYTLPRDTCTGDGEISYSADNLPSWLSFDGNNFSGTPEGGSGDETVFFQLKCKDASGQEASSESKLIISSAQPPKLNPDKTLASQLSKYGPTDGGSGLVVKPNEHWSVSFDKDTFVKTDRDIEGYYGIMRNHTPLPIWMSFSPGDTNVFAGQSPAINSQIAPAQAFAVEYIASDYAGFSAVSQTFSLVVGAHQLTTEEGSISLDAKRGEGVEGQLPLDKVILDGSPIGDQVGSITLNIDGWLKVDSSGKLSGTPDDNASSGPVSATVFDKYGDAVGIVINVNIDGVPKSVTSDSSSKTESSESKTESNESKTESNESKTESNESNSESKTDSHSHSSNSNSASKTESAESTTTDSSASATSSGSSSASKTSSGSSTASSTSTSTSSSAHPIFATQIPDVNATQGGWFSFTIPQNAFRLSRKRAVLVKRVATLSASYNPASAGDFIHFNPSNMTFSGQIPDNFGGADVTVTAVDGDKSDTMTFHINGTKKSDVSTTSSSSSASSSASATSSASSTASSTEPTSSSSGTPIPAKTTNKSNTTAVAVGCGVGIPVGLIALALLVFCCWRRKRHNKPEQDFEKAQISHPMPSHDGQDLDDMYLGPEQTRVSPLTPAKSPDGPLPAPDKGKEVDEDWDTPKRLSAMNFFKVDQYDSDDASMYSSERTHVDRELEEHPDAVPEMPNVDSDYYTHGVSEGAAAAGAAAAAGVQQPAQTVQPRKSWRQTIDSTRRWQDRQSMASLATVSTDELFSVRLVDDEDEQHSPVGRRNVDSEYMNPTQSMILTPRQSVLDDDSPNYHHIGTSSTGQNSGHSAQHSIGSISSEEEPYTAQQFVSNSRPTSSLKISNLASVTEESPNLHKHLTPNLEAPNEYTPTLSGTPNTFTNTPPPPIPAVSTNRPSPSSLRSQLEPPNQGFDFEDQEEYNTPEVEWNGNSSNLVPGWNNHDDDTSSDDDRYHRYHDSVSEPQFENEMNPSPKLVNFTNSGRASSSDSPMSSSRDMENSQSVSAELAFI